jgi:fructose 1,6-bisphosphate aldolase/phosphatase
MANKMTLSVIKADIGSIGGHIGPSKRLLETVRQHGAERGERAGARSLRLSYRQRVAILMAHARGAGNPDVHRLDWDAFLAGTAVAKKERLYGAAMQPMSGWGYTGIAEKLATLDNRFARR